MLLKKLNAISSLLIILVLLVHMTTMCLSLAAGIHTSIGGVFIKLILVCIFIHGLLGICTVFFGHDGASMGRYKGLNRRTIIQRATAVTMLFFVHAHSSAFTMIMEKGMVVAGTIIELLFVGVALLHMATSFSRAFITLGLVRSDKTEHAMNMVAYVVCGVIFIVAVVCFVIFDMPFMAM